MADKKDLEPVLDVGDQAARPAAAKRPYHRPTLSRVGRVRDMTMKTGSTNDTNLPGQTKPSRNPN